MRKKKTKTKNSKMNRFIRFMKKKKTKTKTILSLPPELFLEFIFKFIDPETLLCFSLVNKYTYELVNTLFEKVFLFKPFNIKERFEETYVERYNGLSYGENPFDWVNIELIDSILLREITAYYFYFYYQADDKIEDYEYRFRSIYFFKIRKHFYLFDNNPSSKYDQVSHVIDLFCSGIKIGKAKELKWVILKSRRKMFEFFMHLYSNGMDDSGFDYGVDIETKIM